MLRSKNALSRVWLTLNQWFWRNFFYIFYLSLENGFDLHFNQFESPPPKDHLCQVWLKLAQWF